jgi:hypothetical protein
MGVGGMGVGGMGVGGMGVGGTNGFKSSNDHKHHRVAQQHPQ